VLLWRLFIEPVMNHFAIWALTPLGLKAIGLTRFNFSGGEVHVRIEDKVFEAIRIVAHVRSSDDLLSLLLVTDAARRHGATKIDLCLPYVPYARQDRVCADGEPLSLAVFAKLINAQEYRSVEVWDVHSDTALALIDRATNRHCSTLLGEAVRSRPILVAPDAGALKKIHRCASDHHLYYIRADKTRDPSTGEITDTVVYSSDLGSSDLLIVDDICDGGRTFVELAKKLRKLTTGKINLYVTHGIFSKGTSVFDGIIDHVFVANPFISKLPSNFTHLGT
jgi:ribose-phosphate pyrophosphokinase